MPSSTHGPVVHTVAVRSRIRPCGCLLRCRFYIDQAVFSAVPSRSVAELWPMPDQRRRLRLFASQGQGARFLSQTAASGGFRR